MATMTDEELAVGLVRAEMMFLAEVIRTNRLIDGDRYAPASDPAVKRWAELEKRERALTTATERE